jgi:drug/metabolite transporter (DMT)-like permease
MIPEVQPGNPVQKLSGRWKLGLSLAVFTAAIWGVLPIALAITLRAVDPVTLTWSRFLVAALMLGAVLAVLGQLPKLSAVAGRGLAVLALALFGLVGNFVLYVVALGHASPTVAQIVTQLSPLLLMLGGVAVFHERFTRIRWVGFVLLIVGLALFFNSRLPELMHPTEGLGLGVALFAIASVVWTVYGLAQKWMLRHMQSQQILLVLYVGSALILSPAAHPSVLLNMDMLQTWMFVFCCVNTVFAYGAFAEALKHWEASRVGATLTLTPLFTIAAMWFVEHFAPTLVAPEGLNWISILGALVVVGGSMLCALGGNPAPSQASARGGARADAEAEVS